jgi:hypothetical protein
MTAYELMIKTNNHLIGGGALSERQRAKIVKMLLEARSGEQALRRFCDGFKIPNDFNGKGREMYPFFYIPPYNGGKKYQTVIPMSPKTHILSANSYELEILRLLCVFAPENPEIADMRGRTLARLRRTCFGNDCAVGECFHASLITLRFLIHSAPDEREWIQSRIDHFNRHFTGKKLHGGVSKYFELCMNEFAALKGETA